MWSWCWLSTVSGWVPTSIGFTCAFLGWSEMMLYCCPVWIFSTILKSKMRLQYERKLWNWGICWTGWEFDQFVKSLSCFILSNVFSKFFSFHSLGLTSITKCWISAWCWWAWWFSKMVTHSALKDQQVMCWGGLWSGGRRPCCLRWSTT